LDVLIHGNWHLHHAKAISQLIKNRFLPYCSDNFRAKVPVIDIQGKAQITFPLILEDHDYATVNYYPLADKELTTIAKTMVTSHLLSPLFFQEMRTEKQFGYLVGVGFVPINRYPGIAFYIQSPHTSSLQLMSAIDDFIIRSNELLSDMSQDDWQHLQHGLSSQLQEKDSSLRIKSQRFWAAISNDEQDFNKKAQLIKAIQALSLDDIKSFIHQSLMNTQAPDRLNLMSFKCQQDLAAFKENINVIENIEEIADICQRKY
jgi:secreted Zn-dependent insulinase-like peptidase